MRVRVASFRVLLGQLLVFLAVTGCTPFIADYSPEALQNATTVKAEALALVDKSGDLYSTRVKDIEVVTTKMSAAYEFAVSLPNNQLSVQQWQIVRDPNGVYWGAFIKAWAAQKKMGSTFRDEFKVRLGRAFDRIICLETAKPTGSGKGCVADSSGTN